MVQVTLTAGGMAFDTETITVPAGSSIEMTFVNRDDGVPHNFALYTDSSAAVKLFSGEIVTGPKTVTYNFTAPTEKGRFFFRCDMHPTMMYGTFITT